MVGLVNVDVGSMASGLFDLVDDLFTSDEEREAAKLKVLMAEQSGKLDELKVRLSAILAEANSNDPWTSRARPSFLYIMYLYILAAIPFGLLFAYDPGIAGAVTIGMKDFLAAIPGELYALFGAGYLGYAHYRSGDKKILAGGK